MIKLRREDSSEKINFKWPFKEYRDEARIIFGEY